MKDKYKETIRKSIIVLTISLFLVIVSLLGAFAVDIQKGTIIDPTGISLNATLGSNHTVESLTVFSNGFGFDYSNITFFVDSANVSLTSLNYSTNISSFIDNSTASFSTQYVFNAVGNDTFIEFNFSEDYTASYNVYVDDVLLYSGTEFNFSINVTTTSQKIMLQNIYADLWECDDRAGEVIAANFTLEDEDSGGVLIGDIYVDITYLGNVLSFEKTDVSSLAICMGGSRSYPITGEVRSEVAFLNKHFLVDATFSDVTQTIKLYNFNSSTDKSTLEYFLKDEAWIELPNLIGRMERYYPANHSWIVIQQDKSGEFGRLVYHVKEENTEYRFNFYNNSVLLKSTDTIKFVCTNALCQVTTQIIPSETTAIDVNTTYVFDNATKILTVTWNDVTGATSYVTVNLFRETLTGRQTICSQTIYSASGSYECNTTGYTGTAILNVRSSASPETLKFTGYIDLFGDQFHNYLDDGDSAFMTFGIAATVTMLGLTGSPFAVIVMFLFGLFVMSIMGLSVLLTIPFLGIALVMGIIISILIKRK